MATEINHQDIDDWYNEVERHFELLLPGSAAVMQRALKQTDKITFTVMSHDTNAHFMLKVSRELFAVLMNRTELNAKSHVKVLTPQDGLEAWRNVKNALNRRDGQRLLAEFENLTTHMKPIAVSKLKTFNTLLAKWEKELGDFEAIDREYKVGEFQRRQIIYRIIPAEIQKMITYQQSMGMLVKYDDFINVIKSMASSSMYSNWKAPPPMTASLNCIMNDGSNYTYEQCVAWVQTTEGEQYVNDTTVTDPVLVQAIFAVAKGKGGKKGGGNKGGAAPGKGAPAAGSPYKKEFSGSCHKCGVWGHRINECPQWGDQPNPRQKGAGKGAQKGKGVLAVGDEPAFHFCLFDEPPSCGSCATAIEEPLPEHCVSPLTTMALQPLETKPSHPPAASRPAEGAKWFVSECGVNRVVDENAFPMVSTAETMNTVKAKF